jgi:polar amino acid transport system substrate-binding protein
MKKVLGLVTILVAVFALSACGTEETELETVVVLTSSGYEPYEMIDTNGDLTGFDIELMEALAAEVGIAIEWQDVAFDGIIASLQAGTAEIAIAGMSPSPERAETVDFSDVYYNSSTGLTNFLIFDADDTITGLEDLDGLVVGAQLGTVQAGLLESVSEEYGFTVDLRSSNTQIVEEIKAGRIDVLVVESVIADTITEENTDLAKVGFESYLDDVQGNAIAFTKGSEYVELFNAALVTLQENGTLDELIEKWMN